MEELADDQIHHIIQLLVEEFDISMSLNANPWQVDGGEAEIASSECNLAAGIVIVAQHPGTASHIGDLCVGIAFLIIRKIKGSV